MAIEIRSSEALCLSCFESQFPFYSFYITLGVKKKFVCQNVNI